jgi:predicted RNase H-like HicB family nuclease
MNNPNKTKRPRAQSEEEILEEWKQWAEEWLEEVEQDDGEVKDG